MESTSRLTMPELVVGGIVSVIAAFIIFQGFALGLELFVTPMNHDDFSALSYGPWFDYQLSRPVSTNILYMLGFSGNGFYYFFHATLCAFAIVLSVILAFRASRLPVRPHIVWLAAFAVAATWLSSKQSIFAFQYIGLGTNLLSYCFALIAVLVMLGPVNRRRFAAFGILVLLSALSKEDMVFFLGASVLINGSWLIADGSKRSRAMALGLAQLAVIGAAYGLSILHSTMVGSIFTSGIAEYDVSNPIGNVLQNARKFLESSPGLLFISMVSIILSVVAWIRVIYRRRPSDLAIWVVTVLPFTTALPYLLLPRFMAYYAISFVPLALSLWGPVIISLLGLDRSRMMLSLGVIVPMLALVVVFPIDHRSRGIVENWYTHKREISYHRIKTIEMQFSDRLRDCAVVAVIGVTDTLGPFSQDSSAYLDRLLGKRLIWRVSAPEGTALGAFLGRVASGGGGVVRALSDQEAMEGADCLLTYSEDGRGNFSEIEARPASS